MNQSNFAEWSKSRLVTFRLLFCYLLCYFIFLSDFFVQFIPFLEYVHTPFKFISDNLVGLVNTLFIHKKYATDIYTGIGDTSWFFMASFSYLGLSILATVIWTFLDKRCNHNNLLFYLYTYSRYYLSFALLVYGLSKLYNTQFPEVPPDYLMHPLRNIDSHSLLWAFMAASKSYNVFGGILETTVAILLLFRRTATLGALVALFTLLNILLLNIGYDTLVKAFVAHLILISFFILSPVINKLFNFFLTSRSTTLTTVSIKNSLDKNKLLRFGLKFIIISFFAFKLISFQTNQAKNLSKSYLNGLDGFYETTEFYKNGQTLQPLTTDTVRWRRLAINRWGYVSVQLMNDSIIQYSSLGDTAAKFIELSLWNDSTFKSRLHYSSLNPTDYLFEGQYKNDSIKIICRKINLHNYPLLKDKGKVKWVWW